MLSMSFNFKASDDLRVGWTSVIPILTPKSTPTLTLADFKLSG